MSNGSQCCALEICCDAALRRSRLTAEIAVFTDAAPEYCAKFIDWMEHEDLVFAPKSFQPVIDDITTIARKHKG